MFMHEKSHLEAISRAHLHLSTVVTNMDWPPDSRLVEALADVTEWLKEEDSSIEIVEDIGCRVHLDGCAWPNGVLLGWATGEEESNAHYVYSLNIGEVETYILGKNMEFADGQ